MTLPGPGGEVWYWVGLVPATLDAIRRQSNQCSLCACILRFVDVGLSLGRGFARAHPPSWLGGHTGTWLWRCGSSGNGAVVWFWHSFNVDPSHWKVGGVGVTRASMWWSLHQTGLEALAHKMDSRPVRELWESAFSWCSQMNTINLSFWRERVWAWTKYWNPTWWAIKVQR